MKNKTEATQMLVIRQLEDLRLLEVIDWKDIEALRACVMLYAYKGVLSSADPVGDALENLQSLIDEGEEAREINPTMEASKIELKAMRHALKWIKRIHENKTRKAMERTPGYIQLGF
ncbi:MAG: hypothetical protein Fur0042_12700 [Cyanophyceae cyanobacterium]